MQTAHVAGASGGIDGPPSSEFIFRRHLPAALRAETGADDRGSTHAHH